MRSHEAIDRRSLDLHRAVAAKLEQDPGLLEIARNNLHRWTSARRSEALDEWLEILDTATIDELVALLGSPAERAVRLRQSSPFAGVLTVDERRSIFERHEPGGPCRRCDR